MLSLFTSLHLQRGQTRSLAAHYPCLTTPSFPPQAEQLYGHTVGQISFRKLPLPSCPSCSHAVAQAPGVRDLQTCSNTESNSMAMASNLIAMASNLRAMAFNLIATQLIYGFEHRTASLRLKLRGRVFRSSVPFAVWTNAKASRPQKGFRVSQLV